MEWVVQFEGQMLVCAFLAKALYGAPDREWLEMLVSNRAFESVPFGQTQPEMMAALNHLQKWARQGIDNAGFALMCSDYAKLFVGPQRLLAPPWESVYANKDRAVFQMETASVKNWYLRFDLALVNHITQAPYRL